MGDINEKLKGVCLTAIPLNLFCTFRTPGPGGSFGGANNFNKTVSNVKLNLKMIGTIPGLLQLYHLGDINDELEGVCLTTQFVDFPPSGCYMIMGKNLSFRGAKNFSKTVSNVKLNFKSIETSPRLLRLFVWEI